MYWSALYSFYAVSQNQNLIQWHDGKNTISSLNVEGPLKNGEVITCIFFTCRNLKAVLEFSKNVNDDDFSYLNKVMWIYYLVMLDCVCVQKHRMMVYIFHDLSWNSMLYK